jgi:hypothetical protein
MPRGKVSCSQADKGQESKQQAETVISEDSKIIETVGPEAKALIQAFQQPEVIKAFTSMLEPALKKIVKHVIEESMAAINKKIDDVNVELSSRITFLQARTESIEITSQDKIDSITSKVVKIQKCQDELLAHLHTLDRNSRNCNIKFHGVQVKSHEGKTNHENLVISIMDNINEAGVTGIKEGDFDSVIKITPAGQVPFLLARMKTSNLKKKLYSQRTKFRQCSQRIFVNEDLTKNEATVFKKARTQVKDGTLHSCWSMDGLIYGKTSPDGKPFKIKEL